LGLSIKKKKRSSLQEHHCEPAFEGGLTLRLSLEFVGRFSIIDICFVEVGISTCFFSTSRRRGGLLSFAKSRLCGFPSHGSPQGTPLHFYFYGVQSIWIALQKQVFAFFFSISPKLYYFVNFHLTSKPKGLYLRMKSKVDF